MKVVVINLARDTARWADTAQRFRRIGLQPTRIPAVHGATLSPLKRDALYDERLNRTQYHKPLRPGEIGCYASHLSVWSQLLLSPEPCIAVFEDDIAPEPCLPQVLGCLEGRDAPGDLVKLVGRPREKLRASEPLASGSQLVRYRRVPSLTGGYVIRRRGAEKLLSRRLPFGRPVDVDLRHWWECDLDVRGVQPYPVRHAPGSRRSTIEGRRVSPDMAMRLRKLFFQLRYTWRNWLACRACDAGQRPLRAVQPPVATEGPAGGHDFF
jgi:glycosyl transferase family 25